MNNLLRKSTGIDYYHSEQSDELNLNKFAFSNQQHLNVLSVPTVACFCLTKLGNSRTEITLLVTMGAVFLTAFVQCDAECSFNSPILFREMGQLSHL